MKEAMVIATGVKAQGKPEVFGLDVLINEDSAGCKASLRSLVAQGLEGLKIVIYDAYRGFKLALAFELPRTACQRCQILYAIC